MSGGSIQLRLYRVARRDGATIEDACASSGISLPEARMHDADDTKNPPPPEAYEMLGHNSGQTTMGDNESTTNDQLRLLAERIERLTEEKKGISDDIRDVYAEAKHSGFDPKILRIVIRDRAMDRDARAERDALVEVYSVQLGLL